MSSMFKCWESDPVCFTLNSVMLNLYQTHKLLIKKKLGGFQTSMIFPVDLNKFIVSFCLKMADI